MRMTVDARGNLLVLSLGLPEGGRVGRRQWASSRGRGSEERGSGRKSVDCKQTSCGGKEGRFGSEGAGRKRGGNREKGLGRKGA